MAGDDRLDRLKALVRQGGALAAPEVTEIRPEIRSAGTWHLVDTAPSEEGASAQSIRAGMETGHLLGTLVRQVTYRVMPEQADAFLAWLYRSEGELRRVGAGDGVLYSGTYGVFGKALTYTTIWGFRSFDAIRIFSEAVADPDRPLGAMLREMQGFTDLREPASYQDQLLMPAASGRTLSQGGGGAAGGAAAKKPAARKPARKG